jgi:HSP20 family protein
MKAKQAKAEDKLTITRRPKNVPVPKTPLFEPRFGPSPFNMMRRFTDDMERAFDTFNAFNLMPRFETEFGFPRMTELFNFPRALDVLEFPRIAELEKVGWWPEIEVTEKNGELKIHADLPGMKKEDINVEFTDDALIISGERTQETEEEREGYFHSERNYGSFFRSIPLPEGANPDKANAFLHDGVLEVTLAVPKRELKGRKLEITEKAPKAHAKAA